jgi:hypothetical protein
MSIYNVTDCSASDLMAESYDVGIFASGYESRCTFVPQRYRDCRISTPIVLGFQELGDSELRRKHDKYFKEKWNLEPTIAPTGNDYVVQELLNRAARKRSVKRVLVDYSSMSRLWYAGILNWARYGNTAEQTELDFLYAMGRYEEENVPMIIEDMASIPGCEGGALRARQAIAIFGLGFNGWASLSVLERIEADEVFAFIASPGASRQYPGRVRKLNKDFLEEPRVKKHVIELPVRSVEGSYRMLSELVAPHRFDDTVTLVPMGPKPHVLASILVSMRFVEVSCMRVSAKRAREEKVRTTGEIVAVRVTVKKEAALAPAEELLRKTT